MILAGKRNEKNDKKYIHDLFLNIAGFLPFICVVPQLHSTFVLRTKFISLEINGLVCSCSCRLYVF